MTNGTNLKIIFMFGVILWLDILKEFFLSENIDITIFYHSKSQYGKQIAHLVTVLGQENLISMVYGKKP